MVLKVIHPLSVKSESDHSTNVMFIQKKYFIHIGNTAERPEMIKGNQVKDVVDKMNKTTPYKTTEKDVSPIHKPFPLEPTSTQIIFSDTLIHQNISSVIGVQAFTTKEYVVLSASICPDCAAQKRKPRKV